MATANSDLKQFAVFINSKASSTTSPLKSNVSIPFVSNLAAHENMKVFKFGLVDMLFTNSFYNIRPGVNTLKIMTCFAAGRGQVASYVVQTVTIPYAFYSIDQLDEYLSQQTAITGTGTGQVSVGVAGVFTGQQITYTGAYTVPVQNCFTGFGEMYGNTPNIGGTAEIYASSAYTEAGKIQFNGASMEALTQLNTDLTTIPSANTYTTIPSNPPYSAYSSNYMGSGIYAGVYLIADSDTIPLLKLLGFYNDWALPQPVPLFPSFVGYGYALKAKVVPNSTQSLQNGYGYNTLYSYVSPTTGLDVYPTGAYLQTNALPGFNFPYLLPTLMTDLSGLDEVYVHCAQMRTSFLSSINRQPLTPSDVIAVIPINVSFGSKMSWVPNFQITATLLNTNITHLDFTLTNSNNELLDFNGINWSMTLYCQEEEDESRYQQEANGSIATPFAYSKNLLDAGAYMQESHNRGLLKRQR